MNKTKDYKILMTISFAAMIFFLYWIIYDVYHNCRQDQEIEELSKELCLISCGESSNIVFVNESSKCHCLEPLTQDPKECFDLVDKMIECPKIKLELPN